MSLKNTSTAYNGPVIVIVGPTGSGKTGVAIKLAKRIGGEIISADSRAIYKYMDIGTAKPMVSEQRQVPHFGLDLVEPGERFTVADWKAYAKQKIEEIRLRGHVPMVVGGTGLYVDALVYDYQFTTEARQQYADRQQMDQTYKVFGIKWSSEELKERLKQRLNKLFVQELYEETKYLVGKYGWGSQAMKSNIYQFAWKYLQGEVTLEQAKLENLYDDYHLAKRQMTWFKRNPEIRWCTLAKIESAVLKCIQDEQRK